MCGVSSGAPAVAPAGVILKEPLATANQPGTAMWFRPPACNGNYASGPRTKHSLLHIYLFIYLFIYASFNNAVSSSDNSVESVDD